MLRNADCLESSHLLRYELRNLIPKLALREVSCIRVWPQVCRPSLRDLHKELKAPVFVLTLVRNVSNLQTNDWYRHSVQIHNEHEQHSGEKCFLISPLCKNICSGDRTFQSCQFCLSFSQTLDGSQKGNLYVICIRYSCTERDEDLNWHYKLNFRTSNHLEETYHTWNTWKKKVSFFFGSHLALAERDGAHFFGELHDIGKLVEVSRRVGTGW